MRGPSLIIIARSEHVPALRKRLSADGGVAVFAESESLRALAAIVTRPPRRPALDSLFVTTARGATLVARVKADPRLADIDLQVLTQDEAHVPTILREQLISEPTLLKGSLPLVRCGTRRSTRFPMKGHVEIVVNGDRSQLVDLSITGAQAFVLTRLRPDQPVRVALLDGSAEIRCRGVVVWSVAEPGQAAVRYRIGVQFVDPGKDVIEAFCVRYGAWPDQTFGAA